MHTTRALVPQVIRMRVTVLQRHVVVHAHSLVKLRRMGTGDSRVMWPVQGMADGNVSRSPHPPPERSPLSDYALVWPALTLLIGAVAWFIGTGLRRGSLLSPYSLFLLILISIFGVRPLLMLGATESFNFYGYNITRGYEFAALIGFVGTVSFVLGYVLRRVLPGPHRSVLVGRRSFRPIRPMTSARGAAITAWGLLALWLLAMIAFGGGASFIATLFAGRSEAIGSAVTRLPAVVPALPVVACLTMATVRFRWERFQRYTRAQGLAYWLVAVAAVVPPSALGNRRFLIPSLVVMVVGVLGPTWDRKVKLRWLVGGFAAFLILAVVPFVRSAGSRRGGRTDLIGAMGLYFQEEGLRGTLNNFFLSYDTEMFNYIAYFAPRLGETIPYGLGRGTLGELVTMPIPAALSPFERWADVLLIYAFGNSCTGGGVCPVPSVVGVFYSDFSFVGLVFGMLALGYLAGGFEKSLLHSSGSVTALLFLAAGFSVLFARGNSMAQLWIAVQVFVAWWLVNQLVGMLQAPAKKQRPDVANSTRVHWPATVAEKSKA